MTQLLEHPRIETRSPARISKPWYLALALGWPAAMAVVAAVEPAAQDLNGVAMVVGEALTTVFMLAFAVTVVSAFRRRPFAPAASLATAGIMSVMVVNCPVSGHHPHVGLWWYGQLAVCAAMAALSIAALQRTRA
jgi:hypothetical protein